MFSQSRTTSSRRGDLMVLGTAKLKHRKSTLLPTTRGRRCLKRNYEGIHDRFLRGPVYRDSKLKIGWTEEKCIAMDKMAQENHSYNLSSEEYSRYHKHWYLTLHNSVKNAPMRLRSDFRTAVTIMNRPPPRIRRRTCRTNSFSTVPKVAFVFFFQFFMVEFGQKLVELMRIIFQFVVVGFVYQLIAICCNRRGV